MSENKRYIEVVRKDFNALKNLPKEYLADKDTVKAALVRKWYEYIEFDHGYPTMFLGLENFKLADSTLRYNKDFVKELIPLCSGYLFSYLPSALRNDKELFLLALSHVGEDYVISKLKNNCQDEGERWDEMGILDIEFDLRCEIGRMSITKKAGENLLKDEDVVYEILDFEPASFCNVDSLFYNNRNVALKAVSKGCYNYSYLSNELKQDKDIIKFALEANGIEALFNDDAQWRNIEHYVIQHIPMSIMSDKSFCFEIINDTQQRYRRIEYFINFLPDSIKDNKDFILELVKFKPTILKYVSERLQNDSDFSDYIN